MNKKRVISPESHIEDVADSALRPQHLSEFVGQNQLCENLSVFVKAARKRNEALDHVLFYGFLQQYFYNYY